ncbi:hypothetical protein ABFS82_14G172700 [Erythranthe guttata]
MAATPLPLATHFSTNFSSISISRQTTYSFLPKSEIHIHPGTTSSQRISPVRASSKPDSANDKAPLVSQEDLSYLVKLGGGSIAGAAVIKYGSIIYPEITQPNLAQALFMILAPVVLAVLLLIKQSRLD